MISSNEIKQNLGKNLKKLRLAKGLSQEQLTETVGLERETISSIEVGRAYTSSEVLASFCNFFEVEPGAFYNPNYIEHSEKEKDLKKSIYYLLSNCDIITLEKYYNILITLRK